MVLGMTRPWKHPKSSLYYLRRRVPADLVGLVGKKEVKFSLETKDPAEAKRRHVEALLQLDAEWELLRRKPTPLTQKQIVALAGEAYRELVAAVDEEPGDTELWQILIARNQSEVARSPEVWFGPTADRLLKRHGLRADETSRGRLLVEIAKAVEEAAEASQRKAEGDYSPDPKASRFPELPTKDPSGATLSLFDLLDHKASVLSLKPKTVRDDRSNLEAFARFVGHSDARKVTKEEVRSWRDAMIADGLAPKTINDRRLSALRAVLAHGVTEFDLPENVASGIRDRRDGPVPQGPKAYTEKEAITILTATFKGSAKRLSVPHKRALFWVPWLLAYTGLRVTEATQLRGRHVKEENGVPFLLITPEDGSTKSGRAWTVGIHEHLIELGFLDMIRREGDGPPFYEPYPDGTNLAAPGGKHRASETGSRLTHWIKYEVGVRLPNGRPNHAWRHLFTTRSRGHMDKVARDYMMGSSRKVDARESYGEWPPAVVNAEINKLPRFDVKDTGWRPD